MFRKLRSRDGAELVELAISLPVLLLVSLALINLTLAGFASVNANNAANYAARVGSVHQTSPGEAAYNAAMESINHAKVGEYAVTVSGGGHPGAQITVVVQWEFPNFIAPLLAFMGGSFAEPFKGEATSVFRQEGW
jgi:Flp pilus assembly protein TadG